MLFHKYFGWEIRLKIIGRKRGVTLNCNHNLSFQFERAAYMYRILNINKLKFPSPNSVFDKFGWYWSHGFAKKVNM